MITQRVTGTKESRSPTELLIKLAKRQPYVTFFCIPSVYSRTGTYICSVLVAHYHPMSSASHSYYSKTLSIKSAGRNITASYSKIYFVFIFNYEWHIRI